MGHWYTALIIACWGLAALAGEPGAPIHVARMATAPTVDGRIAADEWQPALRTMGFQGSANRKGAGNFDTIDVRRGHTYCGFTNDKLYIAVVSEMPPDGKLYAARLNRDSDVIYDEGIEIWLDPNRHHRAAKNGDLSFYQFIGNAKGTIYDVRFDPAAGTPDIAWNGDWEYANSVDPETHTWTAELSIPFAQLGWTGDVTDREIGVLVARNFKRPWLQTTWLPHRGAFVSWTEYVPLLLTKHSPTVQITSLGEKLHNGELNLSMRINNPGPARQMIVELKATSSTMPGLDDKKEIALPAQGSGTYSYTIPPERFHRDANHEFQVTVADAEAGTQWFNYQARWREAPPRAWHVRLGPNPDAAVKIMHYPSLNRLKLLLDTRELSKSAENIKSGNAILKHEGGEAVALQSLSWEGVPAEAFVDIPKDLPAGRYEAVVTLDGWPTPFVRSFERDDFAWENNRLGRSDKVFAPFTPIAMNDDVLDVVMRKYTVGDLGLWRSVKAQGQKHADFRELLAGPMTLKVDDGKPLAGNGSFDDVTAHKAVYTAKSKHANVLVTTRCTTEYDGCMKVELDLTPGEKDATLDKLWLDIPLVDRAARLWHVSTAGLRLNPAGHTPDGNGLIWDSTRFPDGNWNGNFKPYIWLGNEERGLSWFADNDAGWALHRNEDGTFAPCLELLRDGGVLTLRVNFVQTPTVLAQPRQIVFGLMATPTKPMPKNWRQTIFASGSYKDYPMLAWMGSTYWGAYQTMKESYPINKDMSILDKMQEMRLNRGRGIDINAYLDLYEKRNLTDLPAGVKSKEQIRRLVEVSLRHAGSPSDFYNVYWEEFHTVSTTHPETRVYGHEWSGHTGIGSMHSLSPSYIDFQCWYGAEFIRRGIGLYFDNTFPKRAYDPVTTAAYRLADGTIQPSANIWRHRDYLRRIWTLHQQLAPAQTKPIMMLHMTNTHIAPYMVWNQSNLDLEWFYGPEPQQSKYPHAMLRAQSLGLQTGNIPLALAAVNKTTSAEQKSLAYRSRFGTMFVHEIKCAHWSRNEAGLWHKAFDFGYGQDNCEIHNYWQDDYPLSVSDSECKSLVMRRQNDALVVFCTWQADASKVEVDTAALGMPLSTATDAESGDVLPFKDGTLTLSLPPYGVRLVRFQSAISAQAPAQPPRKGM